MPYRLDINTLHRDEDTGRLAMNDIGASTLRTTAPLFFEYRRNRHTGSFILIDEATNETVAGG